MDGWIRERVSKFMLATTPVPEVWKETRKAFRYGGETYLFPSEWEPDVPTYHQLMLFCKAVGAEVIEIAVEVNYSG